MPEVPGFQRSGNIPEGLHPAMFHSKFLRIDYIFKYTTKKSDFGH